MSEDCKLITAEQIQKLDLMDFNDGISPYPDGDNSLQNTFARPIDFYRKTVTELVGAKGGKVLDLLCGAGRWTVFLAEQNEEVVGIDRLKGCINIAGGLCKHFGFSNIKLYAEEVSYIEQLSSNYFDTVWMYSALQYVDRGYIMTQINRVLKPGGKLYIGQYNSTGLMLEHLLNGVRENTINSGASQWALSALVNGEQTDQNPNYITIDGASEMCSRFGFKLNIAESEKKCIPLVSESNKQKSIVNRNENLLVDYDRTIYFIATKVNDLREIETDKKVDKVPFWQKVQNEVSRCLYRKQKVIT